MQKNHSKRTNKKSKSVGWKLFIITLLILLISGTAYIAFSIAGQHSRNRLALKNIDLSSHPTYEATEEAAYSTDSTEALSADQIESEPTEAASTEESLNTGEIPIPKGYEARNLLWNDIMKVYDQYNIRGAIPHAADQDPWRAEDGGYCLFIYNAYGTTVLYAQVHPDGTHDIGLWGSQYNKGFIGVNRSHGDGYTDLDPQNMDLLEAGLISQGVDEITTIVANDGEYVTCRAEKSGKEYKIKVQ